MIKRIICLLLTGVILLTAGGCTEKGRKEKLVLALRSGIYADIIKQCLPEFEETHGITCELYELSENDLRSYVLNDSVLKNGSYDLCMVDGSWVAEYVDESVLADLGALGCTIDDDIIPATAGICIQNGRTYLMPYYGNVTVMMYNSELAEKVRTGRAFGSFEDVADFCKKAVASGKGGFVYRGDTENNVLVDFMPVLCAFGGWVVDKDNNPTVNTQEFAEALRFYMGMISTGRACGKEELINGIENGEYAVAIGWPGWYDPSRHKNLDYVSIPGKVSEGEKGYNSNIYGIWTLGIPKNSPNKQLACELLKYLMDPEVQKATVPYGGVPCRYSSLRDPEILKEEPHFEALLTALENGVYRPVMREWPRFYTILGDMMKKIINGEEKPEEGLMLAQTALEALVNE